MKKYSLLDKYGNLLRKLNLNWRFKFDSQVHATCLDR